MSCCNFCYLFIQEQSESYCMKTFYYVKIFAHGWFQLLNITLNKSYIGYDMKDIHFVEKRNRICIPQTCWSYLACKLLLMTYQALRKILPVNSSINIFYKWSFDLLNFLIAVTMPLQTLFVFTFSWPVNFRIQSHK